VGEGVGRWVVWMVPPGKLVWGIAVVVAAVFGFIMRIIQKLAPVYATRPRTTNVITRAFFGVIDVLVTVFVLFADRRYRPFLIFSYRAAVLESSISNVAFAT
jgi:hypothetical protein